MQKAKVNVVAEVSPHHLYFDEENINREKSKLDANESTPPSKDDRDYLIEALREGITDFIATDHAPHTKEEKLKGTSGTPQLDTYGLFVLG